MFEFGNTSHLCDDADYSRQTSASSGPETCGGYVDIRHAHFDVTPDIPDKSLEQINAERDEENERDELKEANSYQFHKMLARERSRTGCLERITKFRSQVQSRRPVHPFRLQMGNANRYD